MLLSSYGSISREATAGDGDSDGVVVVVALVLARDSGRDVEDELDEEVLLLLLLLLRDGARSLDGVGPDEAASGSGSMMMGLVF